VAALDATRPAPLGGDSLHPVHHEPDPPGLERAAPRRFNRFWTALAVGFGVGACAAVLFSDRATSRALPAATTAPPPERESEELPTRALPGCTVTPSAAPAASASPPPESKPPVTPLLEKRFWLERARTSQRQYRLDEAERFYRRALSQAPRDSEALSGLGELELLRGQRDAASTRFREALDANADYVPARVALADLHWQSGEAETARREYRELIERYSADSFPPYVAQRLDGTACVPECGEAARVTEPSSTSAPSP
jgi:tetratricopeptide (TPR) repeat protein